MPDTDDNNRVGLPEDSGLKDLIIERAPVGMALVDSTGTFTWVNPAFCAIAGHREEDLLGKTFAEITHPDDLDRDLALVEKVANREIDNYVMDKRYIRADGSITWIRLHVSGVWRADGRFETYISQIADLNDEKALIEKLESLNRELRQWSYVASHDLQAPARVVANFVDLLAGTLGDDATEEQLDYVQEILQSVSTMRTMVADLLRFSRATRPEGPMAPVALSDVIDAAITENREMFHDVHVRVENRVPDSVAVLGNEAQLQAVFTELLTNAIKHHPSSGIPEVVFEATSGSGNTQVRIADNGEGIPPALVERAFTMFQRLRTDKTGTGIGLAMVRRIIQQHSGAVWVEDQGESGAQVMIRLPVA